MPNAGPPPVERAVVAQNDRIPKSLQNYHAVVDTLKANGGAEAKAIKAMFGGDKRLMDRFLSVCFSLLAADSDLLQRADPMSIVESIKKAASLGLEPMTEDAAIVRYGDKAQLLPMYRGYLKRIQRSNLVSAVDAVMVYENDEFDYWTTAAGHDFKHHPAKRTTTTRFDEESGETVNEITESRGGYRGAYAFARMKDGFVYFRYMDLDELNYVRDTWGKEVSSTGKPLPWRTSYDQMCLKTVIRRLAKALPQEAVGREFLELERANDDAIERATAAAEAAVAPVVSELKQLAISATSSDPTVDTPGADEPEKPTEPPAPEKVEAPDEPEKVERPEAVQEPDHFREGMAAMGAHNHDTEPGWKLVPRTCPACANLARPNL